MYKTLETMGIEVWKPRDIQCGSVETADLAYHLFSFFATNSPAVCMINANKHEETTKETALMKNIAIALRMQYEVAHTSDTLDLCEKIIVFGDVSPEFINHKNLIQLDFTLDDLLYDSYRKRQLWDILIT